MIQEALRNIAKHSNSQRAKIQLSAKKGVLRVIIADAGMGFDTNRKREPVGLGLITMEERVRMLRGTFKVNSKPGDGTSIELQVPLKEQG